MNPTTPRENSLAVQKHGSHWPELRAELRELCGFSPARAVRTLALMLLVAALEGSGLLMLAPLLSLIVAGPGTAKAVPRALSALFGASGLSLSVPAVLIVYLGLIVLHAWVSWHKDMTSTRLQQDFVNHLRISLHDSISGAQWAFLARTHSADFGNAMSNDLSRIGVGLTALLQLLATAVLTTVYAAIALRISAGLTGVTLIIGLLLLAMLRRHHRESQRQGQRLTRVSQRLHKDVSEFLASLKLIKSNNLEVRSSRRYRNFLELSSAETLASSRQQASARNLMRIGGAIALAGTTCVAMLQFRVAGASVLVLVYIFSRLFPSLSAMQQSYERLLYSLPAYASFSAMRAACLAAAEPLGLQQALLFRRQIELQALSYRPRSEAGTALLLSEVNLSIPWRSTTALVGPSGAGKSTLADLLCGLLAPSAGRILVDGVELTDRRAWRNQVAYVSQDSFLLNDSVRNNLLWSDADADEASLWQALEQASAAGFVRKLPQGLDTVLGERGVRLSGGERQRLCIARALLRRPQLLVLDEATSALDHDNERRVQLSIASLHGQLTIVIIAHRLSTVRDADQVIVIESGQVKETGTYAELATRPGSYLNRVSEEVEAT